jgi:exosortase
MPKKSDQKYLLVLVLFIIFVALLNFPTIISFFKMLFNVRYWSEKTIMAVIFLGVFFWQFRSTKWQFKPTYQVRYLLAAMAIVAVAQLSGTDFLFWFGLALSIYSIFIYFYGAKTANSFIVVLLFLVFLGRINSPTALNLISLYLKMISTKLAALFLNIFQIGAQAKGNYLLTKNFSCTVGDACNGLSNIMSLLYLTLVYCYLQKNTLKKTFYLLVMSIVLAVLANTLRIMTIVLIGNLGGAALVSVNSSRGWVMYWCGVLWFLFWSVGLRLC